MFTPKIRSILRITSLIHFRFVFFFAAVLFFIAGCAIASNPTATPAPTLASTTAPTAQPASPVPATSSPVAATATVPASSSNDWTTYHRNNLRTGYVPEMADPQKLTVAWNIPLDGAVYAEPLVVGGHVIVATENDSV